MNNALTSPLCSVAAVQMQFAFLLCERTKKIIHVKWKAAVLVSKLGFGLWLEWVSVFNMSYLMLPFTERPPSLSLCHLPAMLLLAAVRYPKLKCSVTVNIGLRNVQRHAAKKSFTKRGRGGKHRFRVEPAAPTAALPRQLSSVFFLYSRTKSAFYRDDYGFRGSWLVLYTTVLCSTPGNISKWLTCDLPAVLEKSP